MKLYTKKDKIMRIIRAIGILCFIAGMAVIFRSTPSLKETTTVYAESQKQTQLNVRDICLEGYRWNVFVSSTGRIITVEQAFDDLNGRGRPVKCSGNPSEVTVINNVR